MAERPKPPEGYDSWLHACLCGQYIVPARWQRYARAELEELRGERAMFKAFARCNCPDCMAKRRSARESSTGCGICQMTPPVRRSAVH